MARVRSDSTVRILFILVLKLTLCSSVDWEQIRCSTDSEQQLPEGRVSLGRFPWLGVVQHTFYAGDKQHFAVTTGVLIHPGYAIAAAEDIAVIPRKKLSNNTKLIVWHSEETKFAINVLDYLLHPEYEEQVTFATLALLELATMGETGLSDMAAVVLPVCLPLTPLGTYDHIYGVKISDDGGELNKELLEMDYVPNRECEEYYYTAELSYEMMKPRRPLCARAQHQAAPCVWDAGVALVTRNSYIHWSLLGFSTRGAGCGAPARFVSIHDFIPWIDGVLSQLYGTDDKMVRINFRRQNPHQMLMYKSDVKIPTDIGQCQRGARERGVVQYKENSEIITTKNFAQGFFFISVHQVVSFMCITVNVWALTRTNTAVWVEHICHMDATGLAPTSEAGADIRRQECFAYFRSTAYVEFRFFFSFRASFEVTMYGAEDHERRPTVPNPFSKSETTDPWWPTGTIIQDETFYPL